MRLRWLSALATTALSLFAGPAAWGEAPRPFAGVEITVAVQDVSAIGAPAEAHARTWEARTGGRVKVVRIPFIDLFDASLASAQGPEPRFDVLLHASGWTGDLAPYLAEVPPEVRDDEAFDDIHPTFRDRLMTWGGKWVALTIDGDLFSGYYRKDLFENTTNRADFRARYGYELAPPDTWAQYRDIAEFFTGRPGPDGIPLYGAAEAFARGGQQFWDLFSRASAYTNHPGFRGAQFFDPDTLRAQVNNPGWVRAVTDYAQILQFCPPDAAGYGIVQAREAFLGGRTALILDWGDTGPLVGGSAVAGKVGFFVLPGSREVWNVRDFRWDRYERPHKAPFLAFGGWVAGVPANSRHQAAAWDFIRWYSSPANSLHDAVTAGSGVNPYRLSHFAHIDAWTQALSRSSAAEYLGVIQASLDSPNAALDLRLPGFHAYTEALEEALTQVLAGTAAPQAAMDRVARAWDRITEQQGREAQLALYRTAMGLTGPPAGPAPGAGRGRERLVIGFSQATTNEPWRILFNRELRQEAARHPQIELLVHDGEDNTAKQIADVDALIAQRVDAILISPKVAEPLTAVVTRAFNAGIPVFVLDRDLANDRYTQFIGGDNLEIGRAAGRFALSLLGGPGAQGKVVEIWGGMGSTPAQERHLGFQEVLAVEPGIEVLNPPQDGDWKQDLGNEIMAMALERYPHIDLVYAHNDPMAYGAYLAAQDAGRTQGMAFLGIDGIAAEGATWVRDGILTATFLYPTPGAEAIRQALRFLGGEALPRRLILPTLTIDRTNAQAVIDLASD